ncbi:MAG TPA: PIN domain-containing protein [Steroidobacteraceae bacterium]|nr:PIN domain-containing protein [Steroidobacteraceae bacterium]
MRVYAETNFVLELALKQGESDSAEEIVALSETKKIELVLPAFSLVEPYNKLHRTRKERQRLRDELEKQLAQMIRSEGFADLRSQSHALLAALSNKSDLEAQEHEKVIERLNECAVILPLTKEIVASASARQLVDLEAQDALVFASIERHLNASEKTYSVFANKDAAGFLDKSVSDDLARLGCKVIPSFDATVAYLKAGMRKGY